MITLTFTREELNRLFREGGAAALPESFNLSHEIASAVADIVLDNILGGTCL